jgi:type I restriction enzyme M protein
MGGVRLKKSKKNPVKEEVEEIPEILTLDFLKRHLLGACDILRGKLDANEFRIPIISIMFLRRLNDVFVENAEKLIAEGKTKDQAYEESFRHNFFVPKEARWECLAIKQQGTRERINKICRIIEDHNPPLDGVLTSSILDDPKKYPDNKMWQLVTHFNFPPLGNKNLEKEDLFGQAYEHLLKEFADSSGKKAGEFFTPRTLVKLLVNLVKPQEGMKICDPTVGSGGMLIIARRYVEKHGGDSNNLILEGQENNFGNLAMAKMNLILHGVVDFDLQYGDSLSEPKLVDEGKLRNYDMILANYPFSQNWNEDGNAESDPHNRFDYGVAPAKKRADFAFIEHMLSTLNNNGRAAIISSQGVLFRGGSEGSIRKNMILGIPKSNLLGDVIEAVIALPKDLFYATGIPGCIMILNKNKPKTRKNKIILIHAVNDFVETKDGRIMTDEHLNKIVSTYENFETIKKYATVVTLDDMKDNNYNLWFGRYIDFIPIDEKINVEKVMEELTKLENTRSKIINQFHQNFKNEIK